MSIIPENKLEYNNLDSESDEESDESVEFNNCDTIYLNTIKEIYELTKQLITFKNTYQKSKVAILGKESIPQNNVNFLNLEKPSPFCLKFSQIMQDCLYTGDFGGKSYYGQGHIKFQENNDLAGDYSTYCTQPSVFIMAVMLVSRCFTNWLDSQQQGKFIICEGTARLGKLSFNVLEFIESMTLTLKVPLWAEFWDALHYQIIEISPHLVQYQTQLLEKYIKQGKLTIINADITEYSFAKNPINMFLANELLDNLLHEAICRTDKGTLSSQVKIAVIESKVIESIPDYHLLYKNIKKMKNLKNSFKNFL